MIDLGCGEGRSSRMLAEAGARVTGIDLSADFLAAAAAEEVARPHGIAYRRDSFTSLATCDDASFDAAVSLTAMSEPRPSEELAGEHANFRRQRDHAPMLLHIAARKP